MNIPTLEPDPADTPETAATKEAFNTLMTALRFFREQDVWLQIKTTDGGYSMQFSLPGSPVEEFTLPEKDQ